MNTTLDDLDPDERAKVDSLADTLIAGELARQTLNKTQPATSPLRISASQGLLNAFFRRLQDFTVLDPACGSGNFLYMALHALKDIEHRVQLEAEGTQGPHTDQPLHRPPPMARRRARGPRRRRRRGVRVGGGDLRREGASGPIIAKSVGTGISSTSRTTAKRESEMKAPAIGACIVHDVVPPRIRADSRH